MVYFAAGAVLRNINLKTRNKTGGNPREDIR